jgi:hypothetical protein
MSRSSDDEKNEGHAEQGDVPRSVDGGTDQSSGDLMLPQSLAGRLTPEQRAWAASDELPEAEIAARVKDVRAKGGIELYQFVQDLEQIVNPDGATAS